MKTLVVAVLAAITMSLITAPSRAQDESKRSESCDAVLASFWQQWDEKSPSAAILGILPANAEPLANQVTDFLTRAGRYRGRDEASRSVVASRLVIVRYMLRYDPGPVFINITCYRANDAWKVITFDFNTQTKKFFAEMPHVVTQPSLAEGR